jgi:hypothetical protein
MRTNGRRAAVLIAALLTAASPLPGTTVVRVPFDEMVRRSGWIVRATVAEMHVEIVPAHGGPPSARREKVGFPPSPDVPAVPPAALKEPITGASFGGGHGPIPFTHISLVLDEIVKGPSHPGLLKLRMPGGPLPDGRRMEVLGLPRFEVGRRYYLFLRPDCETIGDFVTGVNQGFFRIVADPAAGADVIVDHVGQPVAGVVANSVVRAIGSRRHAPVLAPPEMTRLVRSVPRWDAPPVIDETAP